VLAHFFWMMNGNAYVTKWEPQFSSDGSRAGSVVHTIAMSNAYQVVFECRKCHQRIGVPRKSSKASLSEEEARKMFAGEEIQCPECRWRGKASRIKLLRIVPFNWICSSAA
jgi:DNA-directed RNA polymerase subunit RPC12/RpoP